MNTIKTSVSEKETTELEDYFGSESDERMKRFNSLESTSFARVFTNQEAKTEGDGNWFYLVFDDNDESVFQESENVNFCDCSECKGFGNQLSEYFSISNALTLLQYRSQCKEIELWVSPESLENHFSECLYGGFYQEAYNCPFLKMLGNFIEVLVSRLNVTVFEYSYANKDIIPIFF